MAWIRTRLLKDGAITADKIAAGAVGSAALGTGAVDTAQLADGALANSVVGRAKMEDGFLSADSVGLAKMADGFLTADAAGRAKMADGFISADSVGRAKIEDGAITTGKLDDIICQFQDVSIAGGDGAGNVGDLFSSPVEIIPAQGADTYIIPIDFTVEFIGGSAAYDNAGAGNDLCFRYTGGAEVTADIDNGNGGATRFLRAAAGSDISSVAYAPAAEITPVANTAIELFVRTADPYTAAGDVSLRVVATYRVVSLA